MLSSEYRNLIRFTAAKPEDQQIGKNKKKTQGNLSGEEAKSFYETITKDGDEDHSNYQDIFCSTVKYVGVNCKNKKCCKGKELKNRHNSDEQDSVLVDSESDRRRGNELLRNAQDGHLKSVLKSLETGVPVNYQDGFGWTALMCASVSGHDQVVECLLRRGAKLQVKNNQGKSSRQLAESAKRHQIVQILDNFQGDKNKNSEQRTKMKATEKFYCAVCKAEFSDSSVRSHDSSTVHLFNRKLKPKPDPFLIPSNNRGYQLLRKSGWDGEKGLGPEGKGQKYPIKTVLKRDRKCLGAEGSVKKKAKVTHFGPGDPKSVKSVYKVMQRVESVRTLSRRAQRKKEQRSKEWERNLRIYMSTD